MLSIEEIKLLIEKLEKVKKEDLQELINSNLAILKDIEMAVDANNQEEINNTDIGLYIIDSNGDEISNYTVGINPGDFTYWISN